jgi:hypothetical protein
MQQRHVSPKPVIREEFLKERRSTHSKIGLPLPTCQFHQLKTHTKLPTPNDRLNPKHVTSPPRKKSIIFFKSQDVDLEEDEE